MLGKQIYKNMGKNKSSNSKMKNQMKDIHARVVAWIAVGLTIIGIIISIKQCHTSEQIAHLHVQPNIKLYIKGTWPNFELKGFNNGPIKAINFIVKKVDIGVKKTISKNKKSPIVTLSDIQPKDFDPSQKIWIFFDEFKTNDSFSRSINPNYKGSEWIVIYKIDINYNRESDMNYFSRTILFFAEDDSIFNQEQYRHKPNYNAVMKRYNRFLEIEFENSDIRNKQKGIIPE